MFYTNSETSSVKCSIVCYVFSAFISVFANVSTAKTTGGCGDVFNVKGRVGPWDYTNPYNWSKQSVSGSDRFSSRIHMVSSVHFPPHVANLQRPAKGLQIIEDLNYTLSVIPNHHDALYTLIKLDRRTNGKLVSANYLKAHPNYFSKFPFKQSVDCYFERAMTFSPSDWKVRMLYGMYFHGIDNHEKALIHYNAASDLSKNALSGKTDLYYNMGLLYFDMGNYPKSRELANQAFELGFPLKGLDKKLTAKGF